MHKKYSTSFQLSTQCIVLIASHSLNPCARAPWGRLFTKSLCAGTPGKSYSLDPGVRAPWPRNLKIRPSGSYSIFITNSLSNLDILGNLWGGPDPAWNFATPTMCFAKPIRKPSDPSRELLSRPFSNVERANEAHDKGAGCEEPYPRQG